MNVQAISKSSLTAGAIVPPFDRPLRTGRGFRDRSRTKRMWLARRESRRADALRNTVPRPSMPRPRQAFDGRWTETSASGSGPEVVADQSRAHALGQAIQKTSAAIRLFCRSVQAGRTRLSLVSVMISPAWERGRRRPPMGRRRRCDVSSPSSLSAFCPSARHP